MELKELIKKFEGESLKPYICPAGKKTIGVGINYDDNTLPFGIANYLKEHGEITQKMSDDLLDRAIEQAEFNVNMAINWPKTGVTQNRMYALISVMFNVGFAGFKKFKKMIAAIKAGDWETASKELLNSKRTKQVGERAEIEAEMLRNG